MRQPLAPGEIMCRRTELARARAVGRTPSCRAGGTASLAALPQRREEVGRSAQLEADRHHELKLRVPDFRRHGRQRRRTGQHLLHRAIQGRDARAALDAIGQDAALSVHDEAQECCPFLAPQARGAGVFAMPCQPGLEEAHIIRRWTRRPAAGRATVAAGIGRSGIPCQSRRARRCRGGCRRSSLDLGQRGRRGRRRDRSRLGQGWWPLRHLAQPWPDHGLCRRRRSWPHLLGLDHLRLDGTGLAWTVDRRALLRLRRDGLPLRRGDLGRFGFHRASLGGGPCGAGLRALGLYRGHFLARRRTDDGRQLGRRQPPPAGEAARRPPRAVPGRPVSRSRPERRLRLRAVPWGQWHRARRLREPWRPRCRRALRSPLPAPGGLWRSQATRPRWPASEIRRAQVRKARMV